ncbi:MAG: sugar phosphate isomerase [Kiritimatiellaeota bacterium]|nr:sugar phosphate isomerase [Kiritimatiellota bacterium]
MDDKPQDRAEHFLRNETQFHLGALPTEQPHPATRGLAEILQRDVAAGIRLLQKVDGDVAGAADRVVPSAEFAALVEAMLEALGSGGRICFSGCGATGRLSILLEARWRRFWSDAADRHAEYAGECRRISDRVCSIMTGGDYALIRSVENFEDYISFGRRQVADLGLEAGDVLVAISEGGETSSVIGTVLEARERGATAFLAFNNPSAVLCRTVERSRAVIERPDVTALDLSSGPMAVAGSTRMQATTSELLLIGAALEQALARFLPNAPAPVADEWRGRIPAPGAYPQQFRSLLVDLEADAAVRALADWVGLEWEIYRQKGLVTYFADECLLDILTDTTERNPTFMLPPFRKCDDTISPPSWAFAKNPLLPTPEVWRRILGRPPRCLAWTPAVYAELGAANNIRRKPPKLDVEEIRKFRIGFEDDPGRVAPEANAAILTVLGDEWSANRGDPVGLEAAFRGCARAFRLRVAAVVGGPFTRQPPHAWDRLFHIPCRLPDTPLQLWQRLALKLVFNTVSTATMGCMGRLAGNWMAHVEPTNKKLVDRGTRLIAELAGTDYATACRTLFETVDDLKRTVPPDRERPSPVAVAIEKLRQGTSGE